MCLAIPMRITAIADQMATIEVGGLSQQASLLLVPEAAVGDYVLVHAGCAITVLDEDEAQETFALFAEIEEFEAQSDTTAADGGRGSLPADGSSLDEGGALSESGCPEGGDRPGDTVREADTP